MKKYYGGQTVQKIFEYFEDCLPDNILDDEHAIKVILDRFKKEFPFVVSLKEHYNFDSYCRRMTI